MYRNLSKNLSFLKLDSDEALEKREAFAISLRKVRKAEILAKKRKM